MDNGWLCVVLLVAVVCFTIGVLVVDMEWNEMEWRGGILCHVLYVEVNDKDKL